MLINNYIIEFNNLFTITNLPISRYLQYLVASDNYDAYMEKLVNAFNPSAASNVMCRNTISIGWDGYIYDCDFNQMLDLKVEVKGKRAHSSGIFRESVGAGAVFEMSRILNEFYNKVKGEEYLTFNPGILLGGTLMEFDSEQSKGSIFGKTNVVAQTAVVEGGLRFISEEQKENARAKMREIVSNNLPQTSAEITFIDSYPAMGPTEGNHKLLSILNDVSIDLGQGKVEAYDPARRGAADVSFVAKYVDCLDGLGTMGNGAHTPQETVNLNTIEALTKRTAILIYRLINQK